MAINSKYIPKQFTTIGLLGRQRHDPISDTLEALIKLLQNKKINVLIEAETAGYLANNSASICSREQLAHLSDLLIVVGGDGSLLTAATLAVDYNIPVLGINRGRLGFLADISPYNMENKISAILEGAYIEEKRLFLKTRIEYKDKIIGHGIALNDIVLTAGNTAQMIDFSLTINDQFVYQQRSDGLITATPTGSTAYALSGGGPILHPYLNAIVLVPMFPHTLTARPIVIDSMSKIVIEVGITNENSLRLSCDGNLLMAIVPASKIFIEKKVEQLRLIHPANYNYFSTLRNKLQWQHA